MFSVFPPFYFGLMSVGFGWLTLLVVVLLHVMCFVRRWDGERSVWSYCYYLFHCLVFTWITVSLILAYYWSSLQPQASDTNEH